MSVQLVIAEKPSVARSIAAVIGAAEKQNGYWQGGGYLVSWCIGHLVSFAEAGQYDEKYCKWRYEDLPILPQPWQFIVPDEKKQQFEVLRALLNRPDVDSVTAATDAGREGELIFRFVYQMAGCTKPVKRLWISSMEDAAIREGFANLRPDSDYDALYQSALCRAKADWLVGINATRLFSVLYHKTLTVGRVQTPTLKMLVDRDAKILRFQKEKYYTVGIQSGSLKADSGRIASMDEANTLKSTCAGTSAICTSIKRERKTEQPPKLYDLTTLQREANRLFGFTAKQTLDYNAVKYTPEGGQIRVSVESWEMYVKIDIADTGIGISEQHQGAIFKRFYREDIVHDVDGIGIGLYLAREIVTLQGGYIRVTSEVGKGSTFSVFLFREQSKYAEE